MFARNWKLGVLVYRSSGLPIGARYTPAGSLVYVDTCHHTLWSSVLTGHNSCRSCLPPVGQVCLPVDTSHHYYSPSVYLSLLDHVVSQKRDVSILIGPLVNLLTPVITFYILWCLSTRRLSYGSFGLLFHIRHYSNRPSSLPVILHQGPLVYLSLYVNRSIL